MTPDPIGVVPKQTGKPSPLFDPNSRYSRFRRPLVPIEKVRAYFLELARRFDRPFELALHTSSVHKEEPSMVRTGLAHSSDSLVLAANTAEPLRLRGDVDWYRSTDLSGVEVFGVRVEWPRDAPWSGKMVDCRVLIIDAEVKQRLLKAAETQCLEKVFKPELVATKFELARLLSTVPDLDGWIGSDGKLNFEDAPIVLPDYCRMVPHLPETTTLVLLVDTPEGPREPD